jgi:hypothetical protein
LNTVHFGFVTCPLEVKLNAEISGFLSGLLV